MPYVIDQHLSYALPQPPLVPQLFNGARVAAWISCRLRHLQSLVSLACSAYETKSYEPYMFTVESVLLSMRRVIDDAVMCIYCLHKGEEVAATKKIAVDGYGALFNGKRPTAFGQFVLENYFGAHREAADTIVALSNSFKHSFILVESLAWGEDFPTVVSLYAHRNDFSKQIEFHNHSLGQIVLGFNAVVGAIVAGSKAHPDAGPLKEAGSTA